MNKNSDPTDYIKEYPVHLIEGDGVTLLYGYVESVPIDSTVCIFHTHVANQMPVESKKSLLNIVELIGKNRDVFHIYNNILDGNLHLDYYLNGIEYKQTIAKNRWKR